MDEELLTIPTRICHFLMREYISSRGAYYIPDGYMRYMKLLNLRGPKPS
jgi:hypothetical protein